MKIQDILERCMEIRKERKTVYANYYNKYNDSEIDFDVLEDEGTIVFGLHEEFIYRIYFCSNNFEGLKRCLSKVRDEAVIDWIYKDEIGKIGQVIADSGWEKYAEYARLMIPIPYIKKKKTKTELLLEKLYKPTCGAPATMEDISAIRRLMKDTFDPVNSEIMTEAELEKLIQAETVWIHKVNGIITTCYIYRIEGKKRYGAMTYNCLSADYLYSITRRANDISNKKHNPKWHYSWINMDNKKIIHTMESLDELKLDGVKNVIYKKSLKDSIVRRGGNN